MKKTVKKAFMLATVTSLVYSLFAISSEYDFRGLVCGFAPWACKVNSLGAGGTDHGGPRPNPKPGTNKNKD